MNDFFNQMKKKATDFQRDHHKEFSYLKHESKRVIQDAKKKSEELDQKFRIEKVNLHSKYSKIFKSQSLDSLHQQWLKFRQRHLSSNASQLLEKMKKVAEEQKNRAQNINIQEHLKQASQKLENKGVDTKKLKSIGQKGWEFTLQGIGMARKILNFKNLNRFFISPIFSLSSLAIKNKKRAFGGLLLVVFCYGAGCYAPIAIKDYYLKKLLISQYSDLQAQQEQLQRQLTFKQEESRQKQQVNQN